MTRITTLREKQTGGGRQMRQKNREITDLEEIIEVMRGCNVCRLGLNDEDGFPYTVKVKVKAAGKGTYKASAWKYVTIKIKVK